MKARMLGIALLWAVIVMSGCATPQPDFRVRIDSISGAPVQDDAYILLPANKDVHADDLQFKEYASYVNRALMKQGFVHAESYDKATVAIFLAYGIGKPQEHQYTYSIPTWGQTGVSSSYTTGTISSYGGYGAYSGTTTYSPTYGITGSTTHVGTVTTYLRFLVLNAIDLKEYKKSNKQIQLWKTTVTSNGTTGDLRRVFPILVAASERYIGKDTRQKIEVDINEDDERVLSVKGIAKTNKKAQ